MQILIHKHAVLIIIMLLIQYYNLSFTFLYTTKQIH